MSGNSSPIAVPVGPRALVTALTLTDATYKVANGVDAVIGVEHARTVHLYIDFNPGAAGDYVSLLPMWSPNESEPAVADDAWFRPCVRADSFTAAVASISTVATGRDFSAVPEYAPLDMYPLELRSPVADNAGDEFRDVWSVDVSGARWFTCDVGNPAATDSGVLTVTAILVA